MTTSKSEPTTDELFGDIPRRTLEVRKIDTRGHGGYVVAATTSTGRYNPASQLAPQPLPDWIATRLQRTTDPNTPQTPSRDLKDASAYALAALTEELDKVLAATPGHRSACCSRRGRLRPQSSKPSRH